LLKQKEQKLPFSYAWIVLFVLFLGLLTSFGVRASFGAYVSPWEQDFSVGRTVVTSISTLGFIIFAISQPLAGKLNDQLGKGIVSAISIILVGGSLVLCSLATQIWQLFILFGVVFSAGFAGCSNVTATAIISRWFKAKRGFALGLVVSGMAVGQLIIVPFSLFLVERLSWRVSFGIFGLIILIVVTPLTILLVRSKPEEKGMLPYGSQPGDDVQSADVMETSENKSTFVKKASVFEVIKLKEFWQLAIPYFVCGFTDVGLISTHLIPFSQGRGFATSIIALCFSVIALFNIVGTISTGHFSDIFNRSRQLGIIYAARAVIFIFLLSIKNPWLMIIFAVVYGATEMASIAPTNSLTVSLFEKYSMGTIVGFVAISHEVGGAIGSWVPGLVFDLTGSYVPIFILSIIMLAGGALVVLRVPEPRKREGSKVNI
jgi:sugar phosphate permease